MGIASLIVTFVVIWWMLLFISLPFGVRREENPGLGHETGAPAKTHLKIKIMVVSILAAAITAGFYWAQANGLITFDPRSR